MTVEDVLATLYPDITSESKNKVAPERLRQYERDQVTLSENFDYFSQRLSGDLTIKNIHSALHYVLYPIYHDKLCPGFKNLSVGRQEAFEMQAGIFHCNMHDLDFIASEMAIPESDLYLPGYSEQDLIKIASNYIRANDKSKESVSYWTGEMEHVPGGDWYDAQRKYAHRAPTEEERDQQLEAAVKEMQNKSRGRITLASLFKKTKTLPITKEAVLQAHAALDVSRTITEPAHDTEKTEVDM